jgi:cyd operon protein YbgT
MWYFSWILGLPLAVAFSILNALWLEISPDPPPALAAPDSGEPPAPSH